MPLITVVQTIATTFEVPEGFTIEELRAKAIDLILDDQLEDKVGDAQLGALTKVYNYKLVEEYSQSMHLELYEGKYQRKVT